MWSIGINARCLLRTRDGQRAVLVAGVPISHYAVGDAMAEAYAMVQLVAQEWADQNEVARAFGRSEHSVRRYHRRFEGGGLAALGRPSGYPPSPVVTPGSAPSDPSAAFNLHVALAGGTMREHRITFPEIALIAVTRGMLGVGIGLLTAERLRTNTRHTVGWTLFAIGALSTIPIVVRQVMRQRELSVAPGSRGPHTVAG